MPMNARTSFRDIRLGHLANNQSRKTYTDLHIDMVKKGHKLGTIIRKLKRNADEKRILKDALNTARKEYQAAIQAMLNKKKIEVL